MSIRESYSDGVINIILKRFVGGTKTIYFVDDDKDIPQLDEYVKRENIHRDPNMIVRIEKTKYKKHAVYKRHVYCNYL